MEDRDWTRVFEYNAAAALLLAPFVYILILPFFLILTIVNELSRLVVGQLLKYKYGGTIQLVEDGLDGVCNFKNEGTTRNILIFGTLKPNMYSSTVAASMFQEQVLDYERYDSESRQKRFIKPYDKLRQIMTTVYGYTCWKWDEAFDVRKHFWDVKDDRVYSKEEIMELLSTFAEDMEESKPQWEWIHVNRFQDETRTIRSGCIIRFHHAYMDGLSLLLMFSRQLCVGKTPLIFDPTKVAIARKVNIMAHIYTLLFTPGLIVTELLNHTTKHWVQSGSFPGGKKIYVTTPVIPIETLKEIRNKTKASLPIIFFESFIMAAQQVLPSDRLLPVFRVGEVLPIVPYANSDPHNIIGGCSYSILTPTSETIQNTEEFTQTIGLVKRNRLQAIFGAQPLLSYYSFRFCGRLPQWMLSAMLRQAPYGIFLSNLPGFVENMRFLGADLEELASWPPMPNETGITLCSMTYGQAVKLTANIDPSWLTRREVDAIFERIPKILETIAKHGCIPEDHRTLESDINYTRKDGHKEEELLRYRIHVDVDSNANKY